MKASDHDTEFSPEPSPRAGGDALILAGGVAKGAFAAGAVLALARRTPLRVRRIVATSAGALTAVFLASAVRDGRDIGVAASELVGLWRSKATAADSFDVSPGALASRTGFSTNRKLLALLRKYVRPARGRRPVELRLVMTSSSGEVGDLGDSEGATTFEHVAHFSGASFDTAEGLEAVFRAACASSAFPVAFQPVDMPIRGKSVPCFDGGLVDNAPVKLAVDDPFVSRVFVIVPYPPVYQPPPRLAGGALLIHLAEIVIQERLYRDLREAHATNDALGRLEELVPDPRARAAILDALGWRGRRRVEIVEIRPPEALPGGAFDGLFRPALREAYIEAGVEAAEDWFENRWALIRSVG
jgi:predicted acylesterase/phospholipase RssA